MPDEQPPEALVLLPQPGNFLGEGVTALGVVAEETPHQATKELAVRLRATKIPHLKLTLGRAPLPLLVHPLERRQIKAVPG